jgi:hypothetical protein
MAATWCRFPRGTPSGYVSLCLHCLEPSPKARPSFDEVLARLDALYAKLLAKAARSMTATQTQAALTAAGPALPQPSTRFGSRLGFLTRASSRPNLQQAADPAASSTSGIPATEVGGQHPGKAQRDGAQPPHLLPPQQGPSAQAACSGTSAALPPAWPLPSPPAVMLQPPLVPVPAEVAAGFHPQSPAPLQGPVKVGDHQHQVTWVAPVAVPAWPGPVYAGLGAPAQVAVVASYVNATGMPHQQVVQQAWGSPPPVQPGLYNSSQV